MAESDELCNPWLIAVWPGMGNVALTAGTYLVEKLGARGLAELSARDLFDIEQVEIKEGIAVPNRMPRNLFFVWKDPAQQRDLMFFIGEAQPSAGGYAFCHRLLDFAIQRGVQRVFTFAAMANPELTPTEVPRVLSVATEQKLLEEMRNLDVDVLREGQISGLNGVLLAAGAERGLEGVCLMGELPYFAIGVPNPKASRAVLKVFSKMADLKLDFRAISRQVKTMEKSLLELMDKMQQAKDSEHGFTIPEVAKQDEDIENEENEEQVVLDTKAKRLIESLFEMAIQDRSKAFELKQVLDRLDVFDRYEDRFLDLFKKAD